MALRPAGALRSATYHAAAELAAVQASTVALEGRQRYTWRSALVTSADIVGGSASEAIELGPLPANVLVVAAYFQVMTVASSATPANTSHVTFQLGIAAAPNSYLAAGANMISFGPGYPSHFGGGLLGTARAGDTLRLTLTCTGGAPNTADIQNLGVYAFVEYLLPRAPDA